MKRRRGGVTPRMGFVLLTGFGFTLVYPQITQIE